MSLRRLKNRLLFPVLLAACQAGATAAENSYADRIGVMTHFAHGWGLGAIPRISEAGLRHVRDELYWDVVEPEPGRFVFPPGYEAYMDELRTRDIRPLIALTFANRNYDDGLTPYTPDGIAAYARYAVAVLRHYGPQIQAVEIWNEYNGSFAKGPVTADRSASYLRMLRAAYVAIKKERPDVTVLGAATSGLPMPYLERLFAAGGLEFMDAVSVHPYQTGESPEGLEKRVGALHTLIARYNQGAPKPVWVTEIGWPTRVSQAPGDLAIDEQTQAAFLVRAFALLLSTDVSRVYWYLLRDYSEFGTMGLIRASADYAPKPAYTAMETLLSRLAGVRAVVREPAPDGVYCVRFDHSAGPPTRLLWALRPCPVPMRGVTRMIDLHGVASAPPQELLLTDRPVYLEGEFRAPERGTEARPTTLLAEAASGFSLRQGESGWSYGAFVGDSLEFVPFTNSHLTDWKAEWLGAYRNLTIAATEQHPSTKGGVPVSAVRRWTSVQGGAMQVAGRFKATTRGDGVRVRVLADGNPRFSELLGGEGGRAVVADFDLVCSLGAGGHLDFAVDSGPAGDPGFDATQVSISIRSL